MKHLIQLDLQPSGKKGLLNPDAKSFNQFCWLRQAQILHLSMGRVSVPTTTTHQYSVC